MADPRYRDTRCLDWFMQQANRYPLLTAEQELMLAADVQRWVEDDSDDVRIKRRGKRAFNRFFNSNLKLLAKLAGNWLCISSHLEADDLVQEGAVGLARAIVKYDPTRGYKFSTYAWYWVNQAMSRAVGYYDRLIRLTSACTTALRKVRVWQPAFAAEHGRMPTIAECAEVAGVTVQNMRLYLSHYDHPVSLNQPVKAMTHGGKTAEDMLHLIEGRDSTPEQSLESGIICEGMEVALEQLTELQRVVITMLYGLSADPPMTIYKACQRLKIPRKQIRQAEEEALELMRPYCEQLGLQVA